MNQHIKTTTALLTAGAAALLLTLTGCGKKTQQESAAETAPVQTVAIVTEQAEETGATEVITQAVPETLPTKTLATIPDDTEETTTPETDAASYETDVSTLTAAEPVVTEAVLDVDGVYTTKDDVALYIYTYGELPHNFITKKEAQALGWNGGSLEPYAPGCCIGGSYFGNYEGNLPEKAGRSYTECDIDTLGQTSRGAKRIVFSNDGLIYYTEDHYNTFELLYGEES